VKPEYCLIVGLSTLLIGCDASSLTRPKPKQETADMKICREITDGKPGKCTRNLLSVSSNYVVKRGQVYWMTTRDYEERPCLSGMGAFFHNLTSWKCIRSGVNNVRHIEERQLKRTAKFSNEFQPLERSSTEHADWKQKQLSNYAKDENAVYFQNIKIDGADPKDFSVVFPFESKEIWSRFNVSQSGQSQFLSGKPTENIELSQFRAFTPVRCPGNGLSCNKDFEYTRGDRLPHGILGWIGSDIILLREDDIIRFPNMVSPDMFSFSTRYKNYLHTKEAFYELSPNHRDFNAMNVDYYEHFNNLEKTYTHKATSKDEQRHTNGTANTGN
jgi:hypothetical protein